MADITRGSVLYDAEGNEVCTVIAVNPMNDPGRVVLDFHTNENAKKWEREFYQVGREKRVNLSGLKQMINDVVFLEPPKTEEPVAEEDESVPGEMLEEDINPLSKTKEYAKDLAQVGQISVSELEERIKQILAIMKEQEAEEVVEKSKNAFDQISSHISSKEKLGEAKGDGTKKSIKELIGEIFPSLSFYPALGIWGMVDKMISSGKGFESLTPEQARLLPVYISLFFGLVGGKIAYNRLKEYVSTNDEIDNEINETLRLAGVQLDEDSENTEEDKNSENTEEDEIPDDVHQMFSSIYEELNESVSSNLDDACNFVSSELANKFGKPIPETDEEKSYADELINMATMKYNVPEDSLKDKLGIIEEPKLEQDSEESVPGEKIEEV